MDRVAPSATNRDHNSPPPRPAAQGATYARDAGGYPQPPYEYGAPQARHGIGSGSSQSNVRNTEYMNQFPNQAEPRPARVDSDDYHSNKKPRLDFDQSGQQRPQYEGSYASSQIPPLQSVPAHPYRGTGDQGYGPGPRQSAQRPLAPRPPQITSLPRFSAPVMHNSPPYNPSAQHSQAAYRPSSHTYPSQSDAPNSSFPSPPLISPLNGSPYSRRESTLSAGVPAAPSPSNSSYSSGRDDSRAHHYSIHGHDQAQGSQYFTSTPSAHGPAHAHHVQAANYNGPPTAGPAPQHLPPVQPLPSSDGHPRDRNYPYHDVPYSSGPRQFQYSQPYNTLSQRLAPTLPSDFEDREAYCDSRGIIVRRPQYADGPHHHQQQLQHHHQSYPQYHPHHASHEHHNHQIEGDYYQQHEQQHHEQQQHQYRQHNGQQHEQHRYHHQPEPHHEQQRRLQGPQQQDRHYQHRQYEPPREELLREHHEHQHFQHQQHTANVPQEQIRQQPHSEHAGQAEGEDVVPGWEPEVKPKDIQPPKKSETSDEGKSTTTTQPRKAPDAATEPEPASEEQPTSDYPTSAAEPAPTEPPLPPPAPARAAPLRDILHPVDQSPVLRAAEIPVRTANEKNATHDTVPPPAESEESSDQYSEFDTGSQSPKGGKPERRQRGTFTQEQRDETSQTRTYGACLRCKSQRVRCIPSPLGPYDMCMTCEQVSRNSKKVLHSIRCVRWRLTAMTTYRSGGLELTKRWEGTEVQNVGDWVSDDIKEIDMKLYYSSHMHRYDLCDTPVRLRIRQFAPEPDDVLTRKWSKRVVDAEGTPRFEKKVATLPAFALADVEEAEKALDSYFKTNTINAMYDATRHSVPVIREHYLAAIRHYESFPDGDFEKTFLEKFFRLWFYTRFTTGSSYISGGDKLGCRPVDDPDYPLGNRISVPRMITAQCDSIMVTKFLKPLSQDLILELEKIFRTGNPDNWFTLYICTFMLLGEVSFSSQDRRRHGSDNWITDTPYSLYEFVMDLQFGGNILLCYWHYYRTMDPMDSGWDIFCQVIEPPVAAREKIESAKGKGKKKVHVTLEQRQLVMSHWPRMVELADILSTVHHNKSFEHPLYFVSQMYMREWEIREVYSYSPPGFLNKTRLSVIKR